MTWTETLDPKSPDFKLSENVIVASTDGKEDCDAIDPGFLLYPTTGKLWLTYGTYYDYIGPMEF